MTRYTYFALIYFLLFLAILFNLTGCALTQPEIVQMQEELDKQLDLCNYSLVDNFTDEVICKTGDCACHNYWSKKGWKQ